MEQCHNTYWTVVPRNKINTIEVSIQKPLKRELSILNSILQVDTEWQSDLLKVSLEVTGKIWARTQISQVPIQCTIQEVYIA